MPTECFTSSPFPLPPLAEQRRIVAWVDEFMVLCDRLKASLATSDATRARLLGYLLHETLITTAEKNLADISPGSIPRVGVEVAAKLNPTPAAPPHI